MIRQSIVPARTIFFSGENITFRLEYSGNHPGTAAVRTNLGRAAVRRREVIAHTEHGVPIAGMDWYDVLMEKVSGTCWELTLPLTEVGVFEAKCCFIPEDGKTIRWPQGGNFSFKVEPAGTFCANSIYSAFVRQFGAWKKLEHSVAVPSTVSQLDLAGYTVVPPSGTFRDLIREFDHIFGELHCRILQLLPVHPTPVVYGRMGRYGSPFAATDYFSVDPALAEFDEKATPLEQFCELIDAVHARDGMIFMDIPVNRTGWASKLQTEHPEYFVRQEDGTFSSPGAWGITWADLCKLNYDEPKVHELMAEVFIFWCRRGVDGFRCDAGYMLPPDAWEYITSRVRLEYPDTVFLLEGLGGPVDKQELLLKEKGLNWGYSELFQNYSRDEISRYQPYMEEASHKFGTLVSFSETHDNLRLAAGGKVYAKLRFMVCSLLSAGSSFGFANGAEYFASEKIDVHGCGALNFGAEDNLNSLIRKINILLAEHPVFSPFAHTELVQAGEGNAVAAVRSCKEGKLLILLNLDCHASSVVHWQNKHSSGRGVDLLLNEEVEFHQENGFYSIVLEPGQGRCIAFDGFELPCIPDRVPDKITQMRTALMAKKAVLSLTGNPIAAGKCDPQELFVSPEDFVKRTAGMTVPPLVRWSVLRRDQFREVMILPGDALLIEDKFSFFCEIRENGKVIRKEHAIPVSDGRFAVLTVLDNDIKDFEQLLEIAVTRFTPDNRAEHIAGKLYIPADPEKRMIRFSIEDVRKSGQLVFCSNNMGGYAMFPAAFGETFSKYDAMLAANLDKQYPVDRRVLFSGMKAWLVSNDYSQEISSLFSERFFSGTGNCVKWEFMLPAGQGCRTAVETVFSMALNENAVRIKFLRRSSGPAVPSQGWTKLILRPLVEDRCNHELTKAFLGPEQDFPASTIPCREGFDFHRRDCVLSFRCDRGHFVSEKEWSYMHYLPNEAYYGLESATDRFSPGYFEISMPSGAEVTLTVRADMRGEVTHKTVWPEEKFVSACMPEEFMLESLRRFVVKRDELSTVIAGFPWFLDWGRDTLIVLRGLVRIKEFQAQAVEIIRTFAGFERQGTIPNVIRGQYEANRDTCDAPLYLIVAVWDYVEATGDRVVFETDCGGRTLREVLQSIIRSYMEGTCNGIKMDEESKLIFSPSHFSWMDTNFPAGTPRNGYPIEIQSLWYAALEFMGEKQLAAQVSESIEKYFFSSPGICADCLHCPAGTPAKNAVPDDHNRSNQLLAVTLEAVKDPAKIQIIIDRAAALLVPGGIRTLADVPTEYPLPISHHGRLLNDPQRPYRGKYCGPEDTERKVAYHNGTVWCWPFPSYCEALYRSGGESARKRALCFLMSMVKYFEQGAAGELPEVADGDAPHTPGGCPAQAWSISEFYRVYGLLKIPH